MSGSTGLLLGQCALEARTILNDTVQTAGSAYRYSDQDLIDCINGAMREARAKRPDLFLLFGMRNNVPLYVVANLTDSTAFPLDISVFNAFVYYIVGRCELRDDTFVNDQRAQTMMAKFTEQLMGAG